MAKGKPEQIRIQVEDTKPETLFWALLHQVRKEIRAKSYDRQGELRMACLKLMREAECLLYDPKTGSPLLDTEKHYCCMQAFLALRSLVL